MVFLADMTRERLERAFYQFFSETRLYTGKEFFQPFDARGRFMVPIYLSLLTKLTTSDLLSIRRFYLMHGTTALAAKQWIESQHQQGQQQQGQGQQQVEVDIPAEEARAFANVRILSTAATAQLAKAVELQNADTSSSSAGVYVNADAFYSSSDDEDTSPAAAPPVPATMQAAAVGNAHQQQAAAADLTDSDDAEEFAGSEDEEGPPVGDLQDRLLAASLAKSGSKSGSKSGKQSLSDKHDEALAPADQNVSVYLVHSARADLVKVGFTTGSYEECQKKYTTIYGSLDEFFFFAVENGEHFCFIMRIITCVCVVTPYLSFLCTYFSLFFSHLVFYCCLI